MRKMLAEKGIGQISGGSGAVATAGGLGSASLSAPPSLPQPESAGMFTLPGASLFGSAFAPVSADVGEQGGQQQQQQRT